MQMGGDRELLFRLLCSPHGLALLAAGHTAHVNTTNLRLALMDRCVLVTFQRPSQTRLLAPRAWLMPGMVRAIRAESAQDKVESSGQEASHHHSSASA